MKAAEWVFKSGTSLMKRKKPVADSKADEKPAAHDEVIAREVFYARESDGTRWTKAERRHEIQQALQQLLADHHEHGEVVVMLRHESAASVARIKPQLDSHAAGTVALVEAEGSHHKEMLPKMIELINGSGLAVIHGDIESEEGREFIVLYVHRTDHKTITKEDISSLKNDIGSLYKDHSVEATSVTVELCKTRPSQMRKSQGRMSCMKDLMRKSQQQYLQQESVRSSIVSTAPEPTNASQAPRQDDDTMGI